MLDVITSSIKDKFGSKTGLKNQFQYKSLEKFGYFTEYRDPRLLDAKRLIFICSGNICRSPLAEALAKQHGIPSLSYGLTCRGGDKANERTISFAASNGLNLQDHITKNISIYEPGNNDLLLGMEPWHATAVNKLYGQDAKISLLGLWLDNKQPYLHDPYNANDTFFSFSQARICAATEALIKRLRV